MTDITVLLGDPSRPYDYNPSGRFEAHDIRAADELMAALSELTDYRFHYWQDHRNWLPRLLRSPPGLVLNLCNTGFNNRPELQPHVTALLEMLNIPFIGASPQSLTLCHDKALVTHAAADLGVPVPESELLPPGHDAPPLSGPFPKILKPNDESGSRGITDRSVVFNEDEADRQLKRLHGQFPGRWILAQTFLPGMEVTVGVVGNPGTGFLPLPPIEINYDELSNDRPAILTIHAKTAPSSEAWNAIRLLPARLFNQDKSALIDQSRRLFSRLGCRDYARFDFRADEQNRFRLIDANAHPVLERGGMLATMAHVTGLSYSSLLAEVIHAAERRLGVEPVS